MVIAVHRIGRALHVFSIPKMIEDRRGETMDQLLNIYIETMVRNKVNFRKERRELVIVFTWGDRIRTLPSGLRSYMSSDDLWLRLRSSAPSVMTEDELGVYIQKMHDVDGQIQEWIASDSDGAPCGSNMLGLIRRNEIAARFSIISATGHDVDPKSPIPITPYRVLDPFFWALEFQTAKA